MVGYHLHLLAAELNKLFIRFKAKEATASSVSMVVRPLPMPLYYWIPFPDFYMIHMQQKGSECCTPNSPARYRLRYQS